MMVNLLLNQSNLIWTFFSPHLQTVAADVAATRTAKYRTNTLNSYKNRKDRLISAFFPFLIAAFLRVEVVWDNILDFRLVGFAWRERKPRKTKRPCTFARFSLPVFHAAIFFPRSLFTVSLVELTEKGNTCSLTDDYRQRSAGFCRERGRKAAAQVNL